MDEKILLVGGYGSVGRVIAAQLSERFPGQVIVAGRNYQKAEELSLQLDRQVIPMAVDISNASANNELLEQVGIAVMCLDQENIDFVRQCVQRGIHYVDISASYSLLSKIETLDQEAKTLGATSILSIGLAPGLTNLLVKYCQSKVPDMVRADIYILLGLGEAYGEAALRWTFRSLNNEFTINDHGGTRQVKSFGEGKQTVLPAGIGKRTAYRFDFSDQHVIPQTLGIRSVSTWLCYDSALTTYLFSLIKKLGLPRVLTIKPVEDFLVGLLMRSQIGSKEFVVKVEGSHSQAEAPAYECWLRGEEQGRITGLVAAKVVEKLVASPFPPGVFHIEQLFELHEFMDSLSDHGVRFEEKHCRPQ